MFSYVPKSITLLFRYLFHDNLVCFFLILDLEVAYCLRRLIRHALVRAGRVVVMFN